MDEQSESDPDEPKEISSSTSKMGVGRDRQNYVFKGYCYILAKL